MKRPQPYRTGPSRVLGTLLAALALAITVGPGTVSAAGNRALEILRKAVMAQGGTTYSSVGVTTYVGGPRPKADTQIVYRKTGGKERIKVQDASGRPVWLRVSDGTTAWEHHLVSGGVFRRAQPPVDRLRQRELFNLQMLGANFDVRLVGTETVADRQAYHIWIGDSLPQPHTVREVWIDQSKYVELRTRSYDPQGRLMHSVALDRINFAPTFTADTFVFTPPAGAKVHAITPPRFVGPLDSAARQAGFAALPPPSVPRRFGLYRDMVAVRDMGGVTVLWFQYTDGIRQFSVFQRKIAPGGKQPPPGHGWARTVRSGDYHFTIVGQLLPMEFDMIAAGYGTSQR